MIVHLGHLALARAKLLNHRARVSLGHVDREMLDRLHALAIYGLGHNLRASCGELEALAAHHLNQNRQLQFAAAQHFEGVRGAGLFHTNTDVGQQFLLKSLSQVAAGHIRAFAPRKRRIVHAELNCNGRFVDDNQR